MNSTETDPLAQIHNRAEATLTELERLLDPAKRVPVVERNATVYEAIVLLVEMWTVIGDALSRLQAIQRALTPPAKPEAAQ